VGESPDAFETLLATLLWEGYALYPYTSGAAKNSTPTPFGIVYPAPYAATNAGARESLTLRGLAVAGPGAPLAAEVRFLLFRKPDGKIIAVGDACRICGPVGFYMGGQGITCKMCASPLNASSMGQVGGCNPIPLKSTVTAGQVTIQAGDLKALVPVFER